MLWYICSASNKCTIGPEVSPWEPKDLAGKGGAAEWTTETGKAKSADPRRSA